MCNQNFPLLKDVDILFSDFLLGGCGSKGAHGTNGDACERGRRRRHTEAEAGAREDRAQGRRTRVSNGECWADAHEQRRHASKVARG
jgi:hypothetical protein